MKRLDLYSISFETFQAKFVMEASYILARSVAERNYRGVAVESTFSGTTILSMEMLNAMLDNVAFANAHNFMGAIGGLGDAHQFNYFFDTHVMIEMSRQNPFDAFGIMLLHGECYFGFGSGTLRQDCLGAINRMFGLISDNGLGVCVFHDPFVALAAHFLGYKEARSLQDMESITFLMDDDGKISVRGINEVSA